jgi:hypothetical protein
MRSSTFLIALLLLLASLQARADDSGPSPGVTGDENVQWIIVPRTNEPASKASAAPDPGAGLRKAGVGVAVASVIPTLVGTVFLATALPECPEPDDDDDGDFGSFGCGFGRAMGLIVGGTVLASGLLGGITGAAFLTVAAQKTEEARKTTAPALTVKPFLAPHVQTDELSPVALDGAVLGLSGTF